MVQSVSLRKQFPGDEGLVLARRLRPKLQGTIPNLGKIIERVAEELRELAPRLVVPVQLVEDRLASHHRAAAIDLPDLEP